MTTNNYLQMAKTLLPLLGGQENIATFTNCMTRLRVTTKSPDPVEESKIAALPYVFKIQLIAGTYQIVLGPGVVQKVADAFGSLVGISGNRVNDIAIEDLGNSNQHPQKLGTRLVGFMQQSIMPALGALMAVALINGLLNLLKLFGITAKSDLHFSLFNITFDGGIYFHSLAIFGTVGLSMLMVLFSINAAKALKSNQHLTLLFALFLAIETIRGAPAIGSLSVFGTHLIPGAGGMIGVLAMAYILAKIERLFKHIMPNSLQLLIVPLCTALCVMPILLFGIIPIANTLTNGLVALFNFIIHGNILLFIVGNVILAACYPFLVLSGLHMSLFIVIMPIFIATGSSPLIAAAFLGGAAQLGTAAAVFVKEGKTNEKVKETFLGGAPAALLGVIEPLMYGINLPRVKPLILASVAAGFGGLAIALTKLTMGYALPGLIGFLSFKTSFDMISFSIIWIGTSILGFILCSLFYKPNSIL